MEIQTFYLGCLSHASYLVHDAASRISAVIDPQRDVEQYLAACKERGTRLAHVFLTHFHADFVSGHLELRQRGATIHMGARARAEFPFHALADGARVELGSTSIQALATPGHTPESSCYAVFDLAKDASAPVAVFTGDTLFLGDVGRPDLLVAAGMSAEELAGALYDSLHGKLLALPDATLVYPAHGAGSMCGKNLSNERVSTIGQQRQTNVALQARSREEFVRMLVADQPRAPRYFGFDAKLNRKERPTLEQSLEKALRELDLEDFLAAQRAGAIAIDTRDAEAYARGHLLESVNLGLGGSYATWAGTLIPPEAELLLLTERGEERESALRLGRIGYDRVRGVLRGGFASLAARGELVRASGRIDPAPLRAELAGAQPPVFLDVRTARELAEEPIAGALGIPLDELEARLAEVPRNESLVVTCRGGYRSSIAIGILERHGFLKTRDLRGGYLAWKGAVGSSSSASCSVPTKS
ncbi:MAG: MBL fold metallo-hydrolase [Planctomycetes bacterium]|nr:MBL fold metallo-hydrolase [Planctomycetota bacterium]